MRYDLAFFLCCCQAFLRSEKEREEGSFYELLGVDRDASPDEIKRAYKRQSLQMHPDKLAQRGKAVTAEDQAKFTRMKEAYEVLSDPHKRETYDAIGERGMKWVEEPFSIDPQELAHNFATSSVLDRSKIFAIFVAAAIAVLILPVVVCLHVDGVFGEESTWMATLTPLWLWNTFLLFYHARVIMMGPIPRPESIPEEEWVDPLPMKKRITSLVRFLLLVIFQILAALKLDQMISIPWVLVFFPLYIWEASTLYKKVPLARMRIVTVEDLELALGKPFSQFTQAEKELIGKRYSVVSSTDSPDFDVAQKLKTRARQDVIKSIFRILLVIVLVIKLDADRDWNWFVVFMPFWLMVFLICFANYQSFAEVQRMAQEKDPTLFGNVSATTEDATAVDPETAGTGYGAVGEDGAATQDQQQQQQQSKLTEEEREELKAQVMASSSRLCSKCCSQGFLLFLVLLAVGKLQGAGYSSLWIISPFLIAAFTILCCLGCAIFGVTEINTDGVDFDASDFAYTNAEAGTAPPQAAATATAPSETPSSSQAVYIPPPSEPSPVVAVEEPTPTVLPVPPSPTQDESKPAVSQDDSNAGQQASAPTPVNGGELHDLD